MHLPGFESIFIKNCCFMLYGTAVLLKIVPQ